MRVRSWRGGGFGLVSFCFPLSFLLSLSRVVLNDEVRLVSGGESGASVGEYRDVGSAESPASDNLCAGSCSSISSVVSVTVAPDTRSRNSTFEDFVRLTPL